MEFDHLFWVAFQSSIILGLVHGVNPCGHSWLVLAPLVVGEKRGAKVAFLTLAFLAGTTLACLVLGLTLGTVSAVIPEAFEHWIEVGTSVLLIILGAVLVVKPDLIHHHHDEEHGHDHSHDIEHVHEHEVHQEHDHPHVHQPVHPSGKKQKLTALALFGIGFVNMIIPCPTVAIMYGYALDSGSALKATIVFGVYAVGTAIAVGGVIYAIFHVSRLLERLAQDWVENALMRGAGVLTILFASYSLLTH